jgi:ribosomal protein L37AE/L43A
MSLKQKCPICSNKTLPKRILGFYVGSTEKVKLWECRKCFGVWSKKHLEFKGV